jgi:hypothetical protein
MIKDHPYNYFERLDSKRKERKDKRDLRVLMRGPRP